MMRSPVRSLIRPWHHDECAVCGGRGWIDQDQVWTYLGPNRVPCVRCEGEGGVESGGPVTWTCETCLGTGVMPVSLLDQFDLRDSTFDSQDWSDADLSDQNLSEVRFYDCNFSDVSFDGADLSNTTFQVCRFRGANPEQPPRWRGRRCCSRSDPRSYPRRNWPSVSPVARS